MNTPLYLNDMFCLSITDLKSVLQDAVIERGTLYEDLLVVIRDGIMQRWLMDGTEDEKLIAEKLNNVHNPRHALNHLCIELDLPTIL